MRGPTAISRSMSLTSCIISSCVGQHIRSNRHQKRFIVSMDLEEDKRCSMLLVRSTGVLQTVLPSKVACTDFVCNATPVATYQDIFTPVLKQFQNAIPFGPPAHLESHVADQVREFNRGLS